MQQDYGAEIRALNNLVVEDGHESIFVGVQHNGAGNPSLYMFANVTIPDGLEALEHMKAYWRACGSPQKGDSNADTSPADG